MKLRSLVAVALLAPAAVLAAPLAATKPAAKPPPAAKPAPASPAAPAASSPQALEVGGFIGYETDDVSGIALRLDGELPFQALSPQVKMSWVGSFGYSYLTEDIPFGDISFHVIKLVPAARFTMPLNPQFSIFGDAGLGLAYVSGSYEQDVPFFGRIEGDDSSINIMMRIGAGAFYQVNPRMRVGGMLEFDPIFGDFGGDFGTGFGGNQSTFNILAGIMYKM